MQIEAVDIIQVRNAAIPRGVGKNKKKKLPMPEHGISTIIQITAAGPRKTRVQGLGEVRAISVLSGETPAGAYAFARRLGKVLIDRKIPDNLSGWAAAAATQNLVAEATREIRGIAADDMVPDSLHPAVRLGFDCALLDALARIQGKSVGTLLDGANEPVRRNVFNRSLTSPSKLLNALLRGRRPEGWIRGAFSRDGSNLASTLAAVAASVGGAPSALKGVWFNLSSKWDGYNTHVMIESLASLPALQGAELEVVLEQPFPLHATAWYAELCDQLSAAPVPVRVMVDIGLISGNHSASAAALMPCVDLRIAPQRCGSLHRVWELIEKARSLGFKGRIYLSNAGANTELNSLMLVTLAQLIGDDVLFSADYKRIDDSKIRQAWPQVEVDDIDTCLLRMPEGAGWATQLCRSVLEKRLRKADFLRNDRITPDPESLKSLLALRAFDDSQLVERQLAAEEEEADETDVEQAEQDSDAEHEGDADPDAGEEAAEESADDGVEAADEA